MKLRVRCMESKETLRIQTQSPSTLHDLKTAIAEKISSLPEALHLSLNKKEELLSSPQESLQSLGLASGDLVFYTLNPNLFSTETLMPNANRETSPQLQVSKSNSEKTVTLIPNSENESVIPVTHGAEGMDVDVSNPSSALCFLRGAFNEESHNVVDDHGILIVAVHAVFSEYGFVGFDSEAGKVMEGFRLPEGWASKSTTVSVRYTIPKLLNCDSNVVESVDLKFQRLGKFVFVYGCLSNNGSDLYRLSLDVARFAPSINFVCAMTEIDGSELSLEREVNELWKIVKDGLSLPLHVDLCERTGLLPPPCFMRLPQELKIRVLEFLPGFDILKIASVCSELRYLSSNDDLWNKKFAEEFVLPSERIVQDHCSWKEKFKTCWLEKNKKVTLMQQIGYPFAARYLPGGRRPAPFGPSGFPMFGGEYDRLPVFGVNVPFVPRQDFPLLPAKRNFHPPCNLGRLNR